MRELSRRFEIGQDTSHGKWRAVLDSADQGTFISRSAVDNVERIRSAMAVPGLPLVVIVGLGLQDVLAGLDAELSAVS
ncbi:MAG TPA: hypothetical protein VHT04_07825 [Stellaceae bacterium]|nr:hypothetical protein [Stellaceae bacterium]